MKTILSNIHIIQQCSLFQGIHENALPALLTSYHPTVKTFQPEEVVLWAGTTVTDVGVVLNGRLRAEKDHMNGNRSLFTFLEEADIFGDILAGSQNQSPVTLTAETPAIILFLLHDNLLYPKGTPTLGHSLVLHNFITTISDKYFAQNKRLELVTLPTLREKITAYLAEACATQNSLTVTTPLNREQLAVYLHCDRSALSRELARMKQAGEIDYYKNVFRVLKPLSFSV